MNDHKNTKSKRILIPVLIIIGGLIIMAAMTASRSKPAKRPPEELQGALVRVITAVREPRQAVVRGHGTVKPRRRITVTPQVSGRVEWLHQRFVSGGWFSKGTEMFRIEQADYLLSVEQAQATVARAEYGLAVARADADVARDEWRTMQNARKLLTGDGAETDQQPDALVLHEPQLRQAEAELESAKAALARAELNLGRTILTAPFNCRIDRENIDEGQYINTGFIAASLYSTDMVEIEVGIPISELSWIPVPGAEATVRLNLNGESHVWEGRVDRNLGVIDERERLARVVVQVKNPFKRNSEYAPELSIGTFVEVEIAGRELTGIVPLPRHALRENGTVWMSNKDDQLEIKTVSIMRYTDDEVYISDGLEPGDKIILTALTGAAPGLKLRPVEVDGNKFDHVDAMRSTKKEEQNRTGNPAQEPQREGL